MQCREPPCDVIKVPNTQNLEVISQQAMSVLTDATILSDCKARKANFYSQLHWELLKRVTSMYCVHT